MTRLSCGTGEQDPPNGENIARMLNYQEYRKDRKDHREGSTTVFVKRFLNHFIDVGHLENLEATLVEMVVKKSGTITLGSNYNHPLA